MKISYRPKEEYQEILTILIDDVSWKDVHIAIFSRRPKIPKEMSSLMEWQESFNQLEYHLVKQYVLKRLSSQSYHSYRLRKLLVERLVQSQTIQRIIQDCFSWGYLNDEAWLDNFMSSHLKRLGMRAIMVKLQAKGLPSKIIQEAGEKWKNPEGEVQAIKNLLETRYRSRKMDQYKEKQKVIASLIRKGYGFSSIQQALKDYLDDLHSS